MNDIRSILAKIDQLSEAELTPVSVKHGLNKQQRSAPQMPALFKPSGISVLKNKTDPEHPAKKFFVGAESTDPDGKNKESVAKEDVVSSVKKRLGDYLQDVATAIKKDSDLVSKHELGDDKLGPAVKTITTDDGHEIKIHGNEDDGFRVTVRNRPSKSRFSTLDEANLAVEMFCSRRNQQAESADYIEERS